MSVTKYFTRQPLPHDPPPWVARGEILFITICATNRETQPFLQPGVPKHLLNAAIHYHEIGRWWLRLFLIMPDHVHGLITIPADAQLRKTVASWKSYTAKAAGIKWQRDFFDHRPRDTPALLEKEQYILQNPVRAGLVPTPAAWPWVIKR
jgi:REP element-mobilizing transposase RayT